MTFCPLPFLYILGLSLFLLHFFLSTSYTPLLFVVLHHNHVHSVPPHYNLLRIFRCRCYVFLPPHEHDKLSSRVVLCVFLGINAEHNYRRYDFVDHHVYILHYVEFDKSLPYFPIQSLDLSFLITLNARHSTFGPPPSTPPPPSSSLLRVVPHLPSLGLSTLVVPLVTLPSPTAQTFSITSNSSCPTPPATSYNIYCCQKCKYPLDEDPHHPVPTPNSLLCRIL